MYSQQVDLVRHYLPGECSFPHEQLISKIWEHSFEEASLSTSMGHTLRKGWDLPAVVVSALLWLRSFGGNGQCLVAVVIIKVSCIKPALVQLLLTQGWITSISIKRPIENAYGSQDTCLLVRLSSTTIHITTRTVAAFWKHRKPPEAEINNGEGLSDISVSLSKSNCFHLTIRPLFSYKTACWYKCFLHRG